MRMRFILSETWTSLRRNVSMIISVMLVTFISFVFIGASVLIQAQITKAKGVPGRHQPVGGLLDRQGADPAGDRGS